MRDHTRPVTAKQVELWSKASELTRPGYVRTERPPVHSAHTRSLKEHRAARNRNEAREEPS